MEPQAQTTSLFKTLIAIQLGGMGVITGGMHAFLFDHQDELVRIVQQHVTISKPVAVVLLFALGLATGAVASAT